MKTIIKITNAFTLCIILAIPTKAQYNNNTWIVGASPLKLEFSNTSILSSIYIQPPINGSRAYDKAGSNIQDSSGLLFSCNGYYIHTKDGNFMDTEPILPKKFVQLEYGYSGRTQQTIILPKKDNQFYLFAFGVSDKKHDYATATGEWYIHDILTYGIVDMNKNDGKGELVSKLNYLIEDDSLGACQMSATRHANGRDWWLIKPHFTKHKLYTFLVTPDGIQHYLTQEFNSPAFINGVNGQSNFSQDGSLYAMTSTFNTEFTQVNYFDRCTGKMTKFKSIPKVYNSTFNTYLEISGVCFSPNNRFLYLINNVSIVQYDLTNDERIELITDSTYNPAGNTTAYNARDGKIYIGNFDGTQGVMSYIEFPDRKGLDAGLCQLCFHIQNNNAHSGPNLPNYELGALKWSACDTIKAPVAIVPIPKDIIIVASAFSPNNNGINDIWHALNIPYLIQEDIKIEDVAVYNRWGNKVFQSSGINFVWNGIGNANDSYRYYIKYKTKDGKMKVQKGGVELIR